MLRLVPERTAYTRMAMLRPFRSEGRSHCGQVHERFRQGHCCRVGWNRAAVPSKNQCPYRRGGFSRIGKFWVAKNGAVA